MKLIRYIREIFDWLFNPDKHDLNFIASLRECYTSPTDLMLKCEESSQMRTAAGMFFLSQYYLACKCFIRFPKSIPIELKGVAV